MNGMAPPRVVPVGAGAVVAVGYGRVAASEEAWASAVDRLAAWFSVLCAAPAQTTLAWSRRLRTGVVVVARGLPAATSQLPIIVVWGAPAATAGAPTAAELCRAAQGEPVSWAGVWALVSLDDSAARIVTARTPVATVREVSAHDSVAWATRGGAAHVLLGQPRAVAPERVADVVAFDFVVGEEELLADTHVLPEGATVTVCTDGIIRRSPTPTDLYADGKRLDAPGLRALVAESATRGLQLADGRLGLTGGRDSGLVASCLAEAGICAPTFTLGHRDLPDVLAAARLARRLGCPPPRMAARGGAD